MVEVADAAQQGQVVVYARVSSADQRADLDRQVARVTAWVTGLPVRLGHGLPGSSRFKVSNQAANPTGEIHFTWS
jgi:predicted site-specific integrase-resolvase